MELGEVQLFRLQVPGGTTRGRGRVTNVRQEARSLLISGQAGGSVEGEGRGVKGREEEERGGEVTHTCSDPV